MGLLGMRRVFAFITDRLKNEHGFGFAELMIATSILFMSVLSFTSLLGSSLDFMGTTQAKTIGYNIVTKTIEDIKDQDYNSIETYVSGLPQTIALDNYTFTRPTPIVTSVDNNGDGKTDYKQITVTVNWNKPVPSSYSATTYINPYGAVKTEASLPADTVPPDVSIVAPVVDPNNPVLAGSQTITASADDVYGVSKIEIYIDDVLQSTTNISPVVTGNSTADYTWNTTLFADGIHNVTAKAYDEAGNVGVSQSVGYLVINSPSSDTQRPTQPLNLDASHDSTNPLTNKINLTWTKSADNIGVKWYLIERHTHSATHTISEQPLKSWYTTSLSFSDFVDSPTTVYDYRVSAFDGAGNQSRWSNWSYPDNHQSPSTPVNLVVLQETGSFINFQWNACTSDGFNYVDHYNIYDGDNQLHTTIQPGTSPSTWQTTVNYGGQYKSWSLTITAVDNNGFESNHSGVISWKSVSN